MSDRSRELPQWMAKKEIEKENEKAKGPLKRTRRPKTARSVFYCMNEKELLEAAVSYLTSCARGDLPLNEHKTDPGPAAVTEKRTSHPVAEPSSGQNSDSDDAQDRSYVSESDLDITEAETVPYPVSEDKTERNREAPNNQEDRRGLTNTTGAKRNREAPNNQEDRRGLTNTDAAEEEDDALRLVRKVFFT